MCFRSACSYLLAQFISPRPLCFVLALARSFLGKNLCGLRANKNKGVLKISGETISDVFLLILLSLLTTFSLGCIFRPLPEGGLLNLSYGFLVLGVKISGETVSGVESLLMTHLY